MASATDELLTMLKEQGFEHYRHEAPAEENCVAFYDGNRWHDCWESTGGEVNVTFSMTPEQAIAATLGVSVKSSEKDSERTCGEWRNAHSYYDPTGVDAELWCEHCDEPLEVDWGFCPHCGARIEVRA